MGEFKRRIVEEFDEIEWTDWEVVGWNIATELFEKLVAEALEDFPDVVCFIPSLATCMLYAHKVKEWRVKWFGEDTSSSTA